MSLTLKTKPVKRPRNLALHLLLLNKSKRGGSHTLKVEKRASTKNLKEIRELTSTI